MGCTLINQLCVADPPFDGLLNCGCWNVGLEVLSMPECSAFREHIRWLRLRWAGTAIDNVTDCVGNS